MVLLYFFGPYKDGEMDEQSLSLRVILDDLYTKHHGRARLSLRAKECLASGKSICYTLSSRQTFVDSLYPALQPLVMSDKVQDTPSMETAYFVRSLTIGTFQEVYHGAS